MRVYYMALESHLNLRDLDFVPFWLRINFRTFAEIAQHIKFYKYQLYRCYTSEQKVDQSGRILEN